jgi:chromate reductase
MQYILLSFILIFSHSLSATTKVLAFSGSTREESYNQKLINDAAKIASSLGAEVTVIHLNDYPMPFYDGDLEAKNGLPEYAKKLRNLMIASDAIIIATPEYNNSISAVLKNSIDWASRSETGTPSRAAFSGKRFALMSASPGSHGGIRGLTHLKAIIEDIGGSVISKQLALPSAHIYFSNPTRDENPDLQEVIKDLLSNV